MIYLIAFIAAFNFIAIMVIVWIIKLNVAANADNMRHFDDRLRELERKR